MTLYSNISSTLNKLIPEKKLVDVCFNPEAHALLSVIPKKKDIGGQGIRVPIKYAKNRYSGTFTAAQTAANGMKVTDWQLLEADVKFVYSIAQLPGLTMEMLAGDNGKVISELDVRSTACLEAIGDGLSVALFGSGVGNIGQVSSRTNSGATPCVITLTVASDAHKFEVGGIYVTDAHAYGAGDATAVTVTAIDSDAGTISVTNSGTVGASDYIWEAGMINATAAYADYKAMSGLDGWVPSSAPDSTSWFGVDRSAHVTRLGGNRLTGTSYSLKEAVWRGFSKINLAGGKGNFYAVMHPDNYRNLAMALDGQSTITKVYGQGFDGKQLDGNVGFDAITFNTPAGNCVCLSDKDASPTVVHILPQDGLELHMTTRGIHLLDDVAQASVDSREWRYGVYGNLIVPAPGFCCRVTVNAP